MHRADPSGGTDLRDAMIALHDVLAGIEVDVANEAAAIGRASTGDRRVAVVTRMVNRWQRQHDKLAQFFDLDVYLGRESAQAAA
jgi:hypothetical protein